ncbi:immunity protein Tsi6 family protein [Pedobacter sp. AW31-3R]|uniref:immunity protein Tsi6 family protein n=1 Tax=Pedobacter sp. AW31-3R TaxID=3445781 RepID=UPI003FA0841A
MTKEYFEKILNEALVQVQYEVEANPEIKLNESIYMQLMDIKKRVVEQQLAYSEEEAYKTYSLGVLAIRNFGGEDGNDFPKKLSDIAWGISHYPSMV